MEGHVYQTFAEYSTLRLFNTTTEMLGQYVNKQMKFNIDLMPVCKHIEEPTVPILMEVRDANDDFEVAVYAQRIKEYCDRTKLLEENRRELQSVIWG